MAAKYRTKFVLNGAVALLEAAPRQPHHGVHGVFGGCLPDGWGLLLQDRIFRLSDSEATQVMSEF